MTIMTVGLLMMRLNILNFRASRVTKSRDSGRDKIKKKFPGRDGTIPPKKISGRDKSRDGTGQNSCPVPKKSIKLIQSIIQKLFILANEAIINVIADLFCHSRPLYVPFENV